MKSIEAVTRHMSAHGSSDFAAYSKASRTEMTDYVDASLSFTTMLSSLSLWISLKDRSGRLPATRGSPPHASHGAAKGKSRTAAIEP